MLRLPCCVAGLCTATIALSTITSAAADVASGQASLSAAPSAGPLIIHITRSSASSDVPVGLQQTRCILQWKPGTRAAYEKQCSSSQLPH